MAGSDEPQDEVRETLDEGLAAGKEVSASLEVSRNIGNDADVFDDGGGGKARRRDVVIADAEGESDAGKSLGVGSGIKFDDVAATAIGANAVDRDAVGVLESGAKEFGGRYGEVRGEDDDGFRVSEILPVGVSGRRIECAAGQEAGGGRKRVDRRSVATLLGKRLKDLFEVTCEGIDGVLPGAEDLGIKESDLIANSPFFRCADLEPNGLEPRGNEVLNQKVHVATVAAAIAHDVHDESGGVLLKEGDLSLELLDGMRFVEWHKARNANEADVLVANRESSAEELVGGASSEAKLEAGRRIEKRHRRVKGEQAARRDVVWILCAELPKPTGIWGFGGR